MKTIASILLLAALCVGCVTTPQGKKLDVAKVARIAGAAAYLGGSIDLIKNPDHRPAFEFSLAALRSMEDTQNYDAAALAQAMQGLNIRELKGAEGAIWIQAALVVWDEALQVAEPVRQATLVAAVLPQLRSGLERALAVTQGTQ